MNRGFKDITVMVDGGKLDADVHYLSLFQPLSGHYT